MTERVCEFKWPRSSSLGQCTSVFSSFDELYYSHVHVFTSLHTYSIHLWINLFYVFGRFSDITARQTCNHLCICRYFYPKGIHGNWTHDFGIADADTLSTNIYRHTQTQKKPCELQEDVWLYSQHTQISSRALISRTFSPSAADLRKSIRKQHQGMERGRLISDQLILPFNVMLFCFMCLLFLCLFPKSVICFFVFLNVTWLVSTI